MTEEDITELAAILLHQHGQAALNVAEERRVQHAREPRSDGFRLWTRIAAAVMRLIQRRAGDGRGARRARRARTRAARRQRATRRPFGFQPH